MRPENGRAARGSGAAEQLARRSDAIIPPDAACAPQTPAQRAAHADAIRLEYAVKTAGYTAEQSAQLTARVVELNRRALEILHGHDQDAAVDMPAPSPPAEDLPLEPADAPSYRAERPPGARLPFRTLARLLAEWKAAGSPDGAGLSDEEYAALRAAKSAGDELDDDPAAAA